MTNKFRIKSLLLGFSAIMTAGLMSSCNDSFIFDEEGDCSVHYRVPVTFKHNILDADAITSQVRNVTLYVFDNNGDHVLTQTDNIPENLEGAYYMDVKLPPGNYDMIAWGRGESPMTDAVRFGIGGDDKPASASELTATLPLLGDESAYFHEKDIEPLFWGKATGVECKAEDYGNIVLPAIDLMKDTNVIKVVLQNLDDTQMKMDDFRIEITSDNSRMDCQNNIVPFGTVRYDSWSSTLLATEKNETKSEAVPTGIMTENTTGRIMASSDMRLRVIRLHDNEPIINLDLPNYLVRVKGHYNMKYSDQEYLDRMDQHTLTFFIDADMNWYTAMGININGWTVVPDQNDDL